MNNSLPPDRDGQNNGPPSGEARQKGGPPKKWKWSLKRFLIQLLIAFVLFSLFKIFTATPSGIPPILKYSAFLEEVEKDNVQSVKINPAREVLLIELKIPLTVSAEIEDSEGKKSISTQAYTQFRVFAVTDQNLVERLRAKKIALEASPPPQGSFLVTLLTLFPLIFVGLLIYAMFKGRSIMGGAPQLFNMSKTKVDASKRKERFSDVAGCDEAKAELMEVVEFLRAQEKFQRVGAKIPKGVLLVGPPGTGKTLLAKAVAGEAGANFYSVSGSDFVELFVGVGAGRVRNLFAEARKLIPSLIFIDEFDAVGRQRGAGLGGGHDEKEQTLNQLLAEMDGFSSTSGIIVIAATNRPDVLDPALLRPGRFDRQVVVPVPDVRGREAILRLHVVGVPLDPSVNLSLLARSTTGFTGADLANLVNEAAIFAARSERKTVTGEDFERARDKILMGVERKSFVVSPENRKKIACHEAGHALVAEVLRKDDPKNVDPVHRVTIIPRGLALGVTLQIPFEDSYLNSKNYLSNRLAILFGGRAAEEIVFGEITTGASNDLLQATELARNMVCRWGMSERLGPRTLGRQHESVFLGKELIQERDYSDAEAARIDEEMDVIIKSGYDRAKRILGSNREKLDRLTEALLERETLTEEQIKQTLFE